ncbi:MAG: TonB-dependent receptor [Gammaproteobacteria bacterium]|nr:TonB-dependent receptor [Gammaproteobacteria bacterium]
MAMLTGFAGLCTAESALGSADEQDRAGRSILMEEVIVTAQRREENLQRTPVAVTAFTANLIEDRGIEDVSEVADFTPNMVFDTTSPISGLSSGAIVFLRGIGNSDFSLTTDPGVGIYVDGVYMSRSVGGVLDVLDIERIEVLRGPQGTLFGRNTIGGAINVTARKPGDELGGSVALTAGNFDRRDIRASLDIPISERLRAALAVSEKNRNGFVDRVLVGDALGDDDEFAFRGVLLFEPNDLLDFQLILDRTEIDERSAGSTLRGFTPGAGTLGYALATFGDIEAGLADLAQYATDGEDDISSATGVSGTRLDLDGISFTGRYSANHFDLKYTFAHRETTGSFHRDADNSPHAITETLNPDYDHEQVTHELQLTGSALGGRLNYVAGLYAFDEEGTDNVFVRVFLPSPDLAVGFPAAIHNLADVENDSRAAYLQMTWSPAEDGMFSFTGGVRHTEDDKAYEYSQYIAADLQGNPLPFFPGAVTEGGSFMPGLLPLVGNGSGAANDSFKETTFKVGVDANLPDGTLLYYHFSQGFKSGGFVLRYVDAVPQPRTFEPELLDSHEVGVKWQGLDDRVRLNAAAFLADYQDVQVTFFDSLGGPVTANSGSVDIGGLEIELTALLTANLRVDLGYGYLDADYDEINPIAGLSLTIDESAKLVNSPKHSIYAGVEYSAWLNDNELALRLDYARTDDVFNDSQNSPFLFQKAYGRLNASVRYSIGESMDVVAFAENLTDERYIESGDSNYGLGFHEANYNRPREYGVTIRYRF